MKRLYFNSQSGNQYYYNDVDGNIYNENQESIYTKDEDIESSLTIPDIKNDLEMEGYRQLTLIVTQACNLRCKYCIYSGNYDSYRVHQDEFMSYEIAKKAVDHYFENIKRLKNKRPLLYPTISFYGGEPFLNFSLIEEITEYIKSIYQNKVVYTITSNLFVLTDQMIKFLVENEVDLCVSLNGNREENDKMRVDCKGNGTFNKVMENLKKIKHYNLDYYNQNVHIIATYDQNTNLKALNDFFHSNDFVKGKLGIAQHVNQANLKDDNKISNNYFDNAYDERKNKVLNNLVNKVGFDYTELDKILFLQPIMTIHDRFKNIEKDPNMKFTGMCIPGSKVAVNTDGSLHCCEKVNLLKPIGNVDNWLDYCKISEYLEEIKDFCNKNCLQCNISRLCPFCFADMIGENGQIKLPEVDSCVRQKKFLTELFATYCTLKENHVDFKYIKEIIYGK